jgi:outer membrane protein OmpA-like peptidoglycan-associated protein
MALNLVDSVKSLFSTDLISKAASMFGETEAGISRAISGMVPTMLGGIVSKATTDMNGASSVLSLAKQASGSGVLSKLGNIFGGGGGSNILSEGMDMAKSFFGDKMSSVAHAISSFAGIKDSTSTKLMSTMAPAALGVIGDYAAENNLSASSLSNALSNEKPSIMSALPSSLGTALNSLGLGSIMSGLTSLAGGARQAAGSAVQSAEAAMGRAKRSRWLVPTILILLILAILMFLMRGRNSESSGAVASPDTASSATSNVPAMVSIKVKLPDGSELDAYKGGIEDMLVAYLNSSNQADSISKNLWFDFDNLNFKTGSAEITEESMPQIKNIAAILKAYPKAKIKIGGYTDKTGDESANMKLSQTRAESVMAELKSQGVPDAQIVGAEGYGSQFAKAAADAPDEERKKDRRISVSVRDK